MSATDLACNKKIPPGIIVNVDTQPPTVSVPGNMILEATGPSGATATFTATAQDNSGRLGTLACSPAPSSVFPLGTTTIRCTVNDEAGYVGEASFTVTVRDTTPPTLTVPSDITVQATSDSGGIVNYLVSATT